MNTCFNSYFYLIVFKEESKLAKISAGKMFIKTERLNIDNTILIDTSLIVLFAWHNLH